MSAADYDLLDQQNPPWKPKRDMVATDGMKLTLGDTTLTLYSRRGTPTGTISTIIPVRDGGQRHIAAAWGGTLFNFGREPAAAAGLRRSRPRASATSSTKAGADVILSNHTDLRRQQDQAAGACRRASPASRIRTWSAAMSCSAI